MKLIINADDLGYTPIINQTIFDLHESRRISRASLLVNLPYSQDAIDGLQSYPNLKTGVHLNLTKGRPVSAPENIPSLVNPRGEFWPTIGFYSKAVLGLVNTMEVETELRAQIERVLDSGIRPTHLDSHSHWHVLPHLRKLISQLAENYHIPGTRQASLRHTLIPSSIWLAAAACAWA